MRRCCVALQRLHSARPAVGMLLTFLKPTPDQHKRPPLAHLSTHTPPSAPAADKLIHVFCPRSGCFILFLTVGPRTREARPSHKVCGTKTYRHCCLQESDTLLFARRPSAVPPSILHPHPSPGRVLCQIIQLQHRASILRYRTSIL